MSTHTSYRGVSVDMAAMTRDNEKAVAVGNGSMNARGDRINGAGEVVKTADQIARENHRVQTSITHTGIKGPQPEDINQTIAKKTTSLKPTAAKPTERELPSGDIVVG